MSNIRSNYDFESHGTYDGSVGYSYSTKIERTLVHIPMDQIWNYDFASHGRFYGPVACSLTLKF